MTFRKVGVQPHFDLPVTVDADHVFGWLEVPYPKENFLEAIEGAEEYVQIFRVGDVFYVAESDWYVFDVDFGIVVGVAELFDFFCVDELGVDDGVFSLSPLEEFQVFLILSGVVEVDLVFFNLLVGEVVAVEVEEPVFWTCQWWRRHHMPIFFLEGWELAAP